MKMLMSAANKVGCKDSDFFRGKTMGFNKFYSKSPWDGMIQRGFCGRCV